MNRIITTAERSLTAQPANVLAIAADSSSTKNTIGSGIPITDDNTYKGTCIILDQRYVPEDEIAYRYLQNVGSNRLYISIGQLGCDDTNNYHFYLEPGSQVDISNHRMSVWGYSTGGTSVATLIIFRNDLTQSTTSSKFI